MLIPRSLVPWLCRGMPTGGSASIIFTVFEAEPQTPIPSRSLGTSSGLTGCDFSLVPWLCWGMFTGGSG
jgi:hypothetical protein